MSIRVGILSVAHLHAASYIHSLSTSPLAELVGFWEPDPARGNGIDCPRFQVNTELLEACDAVVICSSNARHAELALLAASLGKHIICEKPIATNEADALKMIDAAKAAGVVLMTGFPCRFSAAYQRLKARIRDGDIGELVGIRATNRGTCPFDWFVDKAESGGGAMIDHVVHVADLLRDLLQSEPTKVTAFTGHNMYEQSWEDTAMLHLAYPGGVCATLDSSWSRLPSYKTWGDVTMEVTGTDGILSLDMFGQGLEFFPSGGNYSTPNFGSNLDALMIDEFLNAIKEGRPPAVTGEDGLAALRVALAGYESLVVPA